MRSTRTRIGAALVVALAMGLVAACGDDDDGGGGDAATDGDDVTISVSNLPPETEPETL
jgi:multiple sugar transport system substrate-binding protein